MFYHHNDFEHLKTHRFRVTNGATYAVEFSANSMATFISNASHAIERFNAERPAPPHGKKGSPPRWLDLHCWDGEEWAVVRCQKSRRLISINQKMLWESGRWVWESASMSSNQSNHMVKSIGGLVKFLRASAEERRENFQIIKGGKHDQ